MPPTGRRLAALRERTADESGLLLIEVLITALLVALIVVGTLNGFDAAGKSAADQRRRSEAALLAEQSQEQLRSDPATTLDALESKANSYTKEYDGTLYTITQEAKPVNAKATETGCSGTTTSSENGANIEISSAVTWALLTAENRPAIKVIGVITPPAGSGLEVDVTNGSSSPVSGVTAIAKFLPEGSGTWLQAEGTTSSAGCTVLTGLDATSAKVEIPEVANFVTTTGKPQYPTKEVSIAPNVTTQYHVYYSKGGAITARFRYKGATEWEGKPVKGDTFVVSNSQIPAGYPTWEAGSTSFEYQTGGEQEYKALTGTYAAEATTAIDSTYAFGDLFPFSQAWTVYAGDCPANSVSTEADASVTVNPGVTEAVNVPLSRTELSIWTGSGSASSGSAASEHLGPVRITNTGCKEAETPLNATALSYVHEQSQTSSSGHLENPFQPFGAATLCMVDKPLKKKYTVSYTNSTAEGSAPQIFLGQRTEAEFASLKSAETTAKEKREGEESSAKTAKEKREKEENEAKPNKEKREKEEKEAKTPKEKREGEEVTAKTAKEKREKEENEAKAPREAREKAETEAKSTKTSDEATEVAARKEWKEEEEHKKNPHITESEEHSKETTQTTARNTREASEKTAREKRAGEEATAQTAKEKREGEESSAKTAKEKRENEEASAKTAKEKREKEEAEAKPAKEKRENEEASAKTAKEKREKEEAEAKAPREKREKEEAEAKASGVSVESGESC